MATATATALAPVDFPVMQNRQSEVGAALRTQQFTTSLPSSPLVQQSQTPPARIKSNVSFVPRSFNRYSPLVTPVIPARRMHNVESNNLTDENKPRIANRHLSTFSQSSIHLNTLETNSNRHFADHDEPQNHKSPISSTEKSRHPPRSKKNMPPAKNAAVTRLTNLELASLSTPELHLVSDPMLDTHEPSFLRRLGPLQNVAVDFSSSVPNHHRALLHTRTRSSDPTTSPNSNLAYSSFTAVMDAADSKVALPLAAAFTLRKQSFGSIPAIPARNVGSTSSASWQHANWSTDHLSPPNSMNSTNKSPVSHPHSEASINGSIVHRLGSLCQSSSLSNHVAAQVKYTDKQVESLAQASSTYSVASLATAASATTMSTDSDTTAATSQTESSLGVDQVRSINMSIETVRAARGFLIRELGRLPQNERGQDAERIAGLVWFPRDQETQDTDSELSHFWNCISDGILLCLLATRLRSGCIDRIDRRGVEWGKADNISRFLRAARDHLGLRSKDLFQTLDLTDATIEGLQRASHTILAIERMVKRSSLGVPYSKRSSELSLERNATSLNRATPPATPRDITDSFDSSFDDSDTNCSPNSNKWQKEQDTSKRNLTILQNRREAERILVTRPNDSPVIDSSVRARRCRSNDINYSGFPTHRFISFADSVKTNNDEESRMPYRDRKLSESAISLTGVAEEDPEEVIMAMQTPQPRRTLAASSTSPNARRGSSSESDHSAKATPTLINNLPLARSQSQRRISAELTLGQLPRSVIGSAENLDDGISSSNESPSKYLPARRHSARAYVGPSLLSLSRESLLISGAQSGTDSEAAASSISSDSRVPFPISSLQADSPGARRIGKHLSLHAGSSADSLSVLSGTSASFVQNPSKLGPRPAFRHIRYSSDLHLPLSQRPISINRSPEPSAHDRTFFGSSRVRQDSEVGSLYTNPSGSLVTDEGGSVLNRMTREPSATVASKHKLVVVEEGKPNVTYQLGNCIGRGQFGSVYRALNLNTGQMVAVKRIKFQGRSDDDANQLMNEVDLLKSLAHPSVVKYEGLVRGPQVVSIILEYVENGSLLHTLKAFGNFPEKLVASYVVKILEGLNYLHEQNVVHCDLKAANILTTKNGNVKLSDFGVSLNLKAVEKMNNKNDAIGTPNWMAPEVIELKGVTTAADIWSLGCTIMELFTGKPPYHDMLAMSAMFRIVEDDCPPIPDKCSQLLRDLLLQCFRKEPTERPSAEMLFEHEWLRQTWSSHKELRPQDSVPFLRRISADLRRLDPNMFNRGAAPPQSTLERTRSSPAGHEPNRPALDNLRSHTTSTDASSLGLASSAPTPAVSPTSSPPLNTILLASVDEVASDHIYIDESRSPDASQLPERAMSPLNNPSLLDLDGGFLDEAKPHAFVKSTFSKAVQCKICRESVKKHAVLCEECGLICHARCAAQAPSSCNLRAQLLMYQHRANLEQNRGASPAPSFTLAGRNGAATSPVIAPPSSPNLFKFPFGIKRAPKQSVTEPSSFLGFSSPQQRPHGETTGDDASSPPNTPAVSPIPGRGVKDATNMTNQPIGQRKRRISLMPIGRPRSSSPDPVLVGWTSSSNSVLHGTRRQSSVSYGSLSGSSSIFSNGGAVILKNGSAETSGKNNQLGIPRNGISTPHLIGHQPQEGHVEATRFRRRLSSGLPLAQSKFFLNLKMMNGRPGSGDDKMVETNLKNVSSGQITPTPRGAIERKKSKRNSSKGECIIM